MLETYIIALQSGILVQVLGSYSGGLDNEDVS